MPDREELNKSIVCPACAGTGKNKLGLACLNCGGMGTGIFRHSRFFYWGPKLGRAMIELGHLTRKFNRTVNMAAYVLGGFGFAALAYWAYLASQTAFVIEDFAFWDKTDFLLLIFWSSVIVDMFVVYRLSEAARRARKIRPFTYDDKNKAAVLPNNWQELKKIKSDRRIDVASGLAPGAFAIVEEAFLLAQKMGHGEVRPLHLFFSSLVDQEVGAIFTRLNLDGGRLVEKLKIRLAGEIKEDKRIILSNDFKEALIEAYITAGKLGLENVSAKNFIIPCLKRDAYLNDLLYDFEVDSDKILNVILWFVINERMIANYELYRKMARFKPGSTMDRAYTAVASPTLSHFSHDLTNAAKWGRLDFCVAREKEIEKIWQNFESGASGVVLVGPPGAGKNTVIDGIAQLMVKEDVPKIFKDKRLIELDVARLVSGATPAQAQERLLVMIDEINRAGNIVLCVNNIENMMGITSGGEESLDLSEVLVSALEQRAFYCLAAVTNENYTKYLEGHPLGNALDRVMINEPAGNQAIQIIESKIGRFEGQYKVYFSYAAIEQVIKLSSRYISDRYLPQKAIHILELVAVRAAKEKGEQSLVTDDDIAAVISDLTNIPVTKVTESEGESLLHLEDKIHERMVNQEEAVKMVAASLRRARTELREGKRPIANFLFLGPTGVGKTELAKTVAGVYFGHERYMIRLDMSEYQHPDSVKNMIGDATGIRGYLTEAVRKAPYSLILLDEIEKAHPDIMNLFLQVMDDGRLTDGQGRTVDFTSSILIATSNAGALYIQKEVLAGTSLDQIKEVLINDHLNQVMRPELVNRFDGVIVFEPLSMENVVEVAVLMLDSIRKMLNDKGMELVTDPSGVRKLAELGYDPKFGARPLRRLLQEKIEDKIANRILSGELKRRDTVIIDENAQVQVEKARPL